MADIIINAEVSGAINNLNKVDESLKDISKSYDDLNSASNKAFNNQEKEVKQSISLIEDLEDTINDWEQARKKATNVKDIQNYNNKIQEGRKNLEEYKTMGLPAMKTVNKEASAGSKIFAQLGGIIAGAFSVGALVSFGKQIIETTAKFQKMEAVLKTSLGSSSAANAAMSNIVDFASKTPFQVDELTDSFVKLANRGFVPTMDEMKSLGDLASASGKSFDQLAEAILDAQTGELKRLKDFGITGKESGDKMIFTFKGVTTEVEKTDGAIKDYILSLGNAEGVTGSMDEINKTLGGTISNLGDSWDMFLLSLGETEGKIGIVSGFIQGLTDALADMTGTLNAELVGNWEKLADIWGKLNSGGSDLDAVILRNKALEKQL
jgi:hypothetical protein